jgi:hypothetical protein
MSRTKKKPTLQLRKPGQTSARDAFIAGESLDDAVIHNAEPERSDVQTLKRVDVQTSTPSEAQAPASTSSDKVEATPPLAQGNPKPVRKRTTIYFDDDVYKSLKVHCAMHGLEMSQTVSAVMARWLDEQ